MTKKTTLTVALCLFIACMHTSCESPTPQQEVIEAPKDPSMAKVRKLKGLYLFINSDPVSQFDYLGSERVDFLSQVNIQKGDKAGQILRDIAGTIQRNVDMNELLNQITENVKKRYPEANAIIIDDKLTQCEVIKLK